MDVYATIQSFQLPSEVGDEPLSKDTQDLPLHTPTVKLLPKDEADPCMLDLGVYVVHTHYCLHFLEVFNPLQVVCSSW